MFLLIPVCTAVHLHIVITIEFYRIITISLSSHIITHGGKKLVVKLRKKHFFVSILLFTIEHHNILLLLIIVLHNVCERKNPFSHRKFAVNIRRFEQQLNLYANRVER